MLQACFWKRASTLFCERCLMAVTTVELQRQTNIEGHCYAAVGHDSTADSVGSLTLDRSWVVSHEVALTNKRLDRAGERMTLIKTPGSQLTAELPRLDLLPTCSASLAPGCLLSIVQRPRRRSLNACARIMHNSAACSTWRTWVINDSDIAECVVPSDLWMPITRNQFLYHYSISTWLSIMRSRQLLSICRPSIFAARDINST